VYAFDLAEIQLLPVSNCADCGNLIAFAHQDVEQAGDVDPKNNRTDLVLTRSC
jgi:hypothetical protein